MLVAGGLEGAAAMGGVPLSKDEELRTEREKAEARIAYVSITCLFSNNVHNYDARDLWLIPPLPIVASRNL